jgi:hypothetical protein
MGYSNIAVALLLGAAYSTKVKLDKKTSNVTRPFYTPV